MKRFTRRLSAAATILRVPSTLVRFCARLRGDHIEVRLCACRIQDLQEDVLGVVALARFDGGGKATKHDACVGVCSTDRVRRSGEECGIGVRVGITAPGIAQVGIVPDLVIDERVAITRGDHIRKMGKGRRIGCAGRRPKVLTSGVSSFTEVTRALLGI